MKVALIIITLGVLSGCAATKEVSAPCKRPANLTSYAEVEPRKDCGPMALVNDGQSAVEALNEIVLAP